MSHAFKNELIEFLTRLETDHLPAKRRQEIGTIVAHLSAKTIIIPKVSESEVQISRFIELFFSAYPALMTSSNRIKLEHYLNNARQNAIPKQHPAKKIK